MIEFSGKVGHLEDVGWPWANAGGVVKTVMDTEAMAQTGVGWIEDGSHTLLPRLGYAVDPEHPELGAQRTVYTHNPITGETGNCLGMPGAGMDILEKEIPEKVNIAESHHKKYVLNVAPVSGEPIKETQELVSRAYSANAHAVLVNGGCPNVVTEDGGRHELLSRNPKKLGEVLYGLSPIVEKFSPVFLRISPQESYAQAKLIFEVIKNSGVVSAVFLPNTWPSYRPLDEQGEPILEVSLGAGGKSGPATAEESTEQTVWAIELLKGSKIDVVSSSGIKDSSELRKRLGIGAVAGAGTTFYYESEDGWIDDTDKLLSELAG